ncbi:MAG TPA: hypothetical protein VFO28_00205 [Burkholderiaceae bacterium]|nr:hypothetical protein [Burkholderiaceae bacterium]
MTRISSRFTVVTKWGLPIGWFAFFVAFLAAGPSDAGPVPVSLVVIFGIAVAGFFAMRLLVSDLADSVLDGGTYLQVRRGRVEARIAFHDIVDVSVSKYSRPPRVVLRLAQAGPLGTSIPFLTDSAFTLNPFVDNVMALKLLERALAARATRAS